MVHSLNPQNQIWLSSESSGWIVSNLKYVFHPNLIPSFEDFESGATSFSETEYEDLLFIPVLGHFFTEISLPPTPLLLSFQFAFEDRVLKSQELLDSAALENSYPLCTHIIGVDLVEDFTDANDVLVEAMRRAERVAQIFSLSKNQQVHQELIQSMSDEEFVDVFLYSKIAGVHSEFAFPEIPRPVSTIDLIRQKIQLVDDSWNSGEPNQLETHDLISNYTTCVLFEESSKEPKHLVQLFPTGRKIRRDKSWIDLPLDEEWSNQWTWRTIVTSHIDLVVSGFDFDPNNFQAPQSVLLPETPLFNSNPQGLIPFINSEIIFTDKNGVLCCTANYGEKKQLWPDLSSALGLKIHEAWVLRFDDLGRDANRPALSTYQDQLSLLELDNYTVMECWVRMVGSSEHIPAFFIPISTREVSDTVSGDMTIAAMQTGQQGVYRLKGDIQEVVFGTNVNFKGSRRFNIGFA